MRHFDEAIAGDLRTSFEESVLTWSSVTAQSAYGCPAYFVDGEFFAALVTDGVVLPWLSDADRERVDRDFQTGPFRAEQAGEWVEIAVVDGHALNSVLPFVRSSYDAARRIAG